MQACRRDVCARRTFIGLHQRDNERLLQTPIPLRDLGNTVIVVEHDEDAIRMADHDRHRPGAGVHGGEVICDGPIEKIIASEESVTGQYISGKRCIHRYAAYSVRQNSVIELFGARGNNLRNVDLTIPIGLFTCGDGRIGFR